MGAQHFDRSPGRPDSEVGHAAQLAERTVRPPAAGRLRATTGRRAGRDVRVAAAVLAGLLRSLSSAAEPREAAGTAAAARDRCSRPRRLRQIQPPAAP